MKLDSSFARRSAVSVALGVGCVLSMTPAPLVAQDAAQPARQALDQVLGSVTAVNTADKSFTVKEDKTGTEYTVSTASTRRFLKVPPGEKDLKKAQPVDLSQIAVGDRLLARGQKDGASPKLNAAIVIVMTAGELQQKHESELADWQNRGSRGTVAAVDAATNQITMNLRGPEGQKTVAVTTTPTTQFTRYSPESVKYSDVKPSSFAALKAGDQLRVLGDANADGSEIKAERVISGSFRTVAATITAISPDGKLIQATDMQTKQPVMVALTDDSAVRRLPPAMAAAMAHRLNPNAKGAAQGGNPGPTPEGGAAPGKETTAGGEAGAAARPARGGPAGGDISQMVERLPKIAVSELKPGEAVVISGGAGDDKSHLTAINIISGVEPLFASAPPSSGRSSALGMWNLDIGAPGEQ